MPTVDINIWAVLVCALVNMIVGSLWYAPSSPTGRMWMKEMGFDPKKIDPSKMEGMWRYYLAAAVGALVMAYVFAHVLDFAQADSLVEGFQGAVWMWLGFVAVVSLGSVLWEGKSLKYYAVTTSYYLVTLLIMSAILVSWV